MEDWELVIKELPKVRSDRYGELLKLEAQSWAVEKGIAPSFRPIICTSQPYLIAHAHSTVQERCHHAMAVERFRNWVHLDDPYGSRL